MSTDADILRESEIYNLSHRLADMRAEKRELEARIKALNTELVAALEAHGGQILTDTIDGRTEKVYVRANTRRTWDLPRLEQLLPHVYPDVIKVSIDNEAVDVAWNAGRIPIDVWDQVVHESTTAAWVDVIDVTPDPEGTDQ